MRRLAPDAWIVDFTNPVGIVTRALLDKGHRAVGLCSAAMVFQRHSTASGRARAAVLEVAAQGDDVARRLVERLAGEIVLLAVKALGDLRLISTGDCPPRGQSPERPADVVLGGGMLRQGRGLLHDEVVARLRERAPAARPVVATDPPVLGAALAALDAARAPEGAGETLRTAFRSGLEPVAA